MIKHLNRQTRSASRIFTLVFVLLGATQIHAQGTVEQVKVYGESLAHNLEGDDPQRDVFVYLPADYSSSDKAYPVIYFLHGYAVGASVYVNAVLNLPEAVNSAIDGGAKEAIIVVPDAFTRFGGSFYSNSPTIGDWESFIAKDLVAYIDSHYRTIARREGRGLSGHSMGGYGTLRVGMRFPEIFGALYAMSSGAVLEEIPGPEAVIAEYARMAAGIETQAGTFINGMQAKAAAWSSNPLSAPYFIDLPYTEKGAINPLIAERWTANSLLISVDQHVPALQSFSAIMMDVGNEDGLEATNTQLDAAMTRLGVPHDYEVYQGNHGNRVGQRFVQNVMPFFAASLATE